MDQIEAKRLIAGGENEQVEFKTKTSHPEKIMREVVAFANTRGGHLFVGVFDDKSIAGLKYPDEDQYLLDRAISELCFPTVNYEVETITFKSGNQILHYLIKEGEHKPYFVLNDEGSAGRRAYIRVEDMSVQASYEVRRFLRDGNKEQGPVRLGPETEILFKFFESNDSITLSKYCELSGFNKKLASRTLVRLALSGALKIEPRAGEDLFLPTE